MQAFDNDEDVHTATAALMLGIPREQVTSESRAVGKTMNFALLYGMGAKSLAERLAIPKEEGQRLYQQYFSAYSAISVWVERVTAEGKKRGYTVSMFGRRFTIWEFTSDDSYIYSKGERLCVNAPIQGAAADYMKIAMVRADDALAKAGLKDRVHLVMNIHDALEFYVHESVSPEEVIEVLRPAVEFTVPKLPKIVADWHVGKKWGQVEDWIPGEGAVREVVPAVEAVEDPHEALESFSEASPEAVKSVLEASPEAVEADPGVGGGTVVVVIPEMPTADQYRGWLDWLDVNRGPYAVVLRTPEGDIEHEGRSSSLNLGNKGEVNLIFPGAEILVDAGSVDFGDVAIEV